MRRAILYYSSITEPELSMVLDEDEQAYLDSIDYELELVDVAEDPERANQDGILMTPTVVLEKDGEVERFHGTISQLHDLLEKSLDRGDLIFLRTFDEAQEDADAWDLVEADRETIEQRLQEEFSGGIISGLELERLDREDKTGLVHLEITEEDINPVLLKNLEAYLSGLFTEIMDDVVLVESQGHEDGYYHFHIGVEETDEMTTIRDRVERVLD